MSERKTLQQFDFIRTVACIGIVLYHFSVESKWFEMFKFYKYAGGNCNLG